MCPEVESGATVPAAGEQLPAESSLVAPWILRLDTFTGELVEASAIAQAFGVTSRNVREVLARRGISPRSGERSGRGRPPATYVVPELACLARATRAALEADEVPAGVLVRQGDQWALDGERLTEGTPLRVAIAGRWFEGRFSPVRGPRLVDATTGVWEIPLDAGIPAQRAEKAPRTGGA